MTKPRLLVVEGDTAASRAREIEVGGVATSDGYADVLRGLSPHARIDIAYPADSDDDLPSGADLAGYDGIALTGSALHVYDDNHAVTRQIAYLREALRHDIAVFGSCWGLQLLTVAAGGVVRRNPRGRELCFGRDIRLTETGREHPMYRGKPTSFCAPTVHLDEVATLAPGSTLLASNAFSTVQAIMMQTRAVTAWAVQYHPEYPLRELAAIVRRSPSLVEEGFFGDDADREAYARDLAILDRAPDTRRLAWRFGLDAAVLDPSLRTRELANWLTDVVTPRMRRRASVS